MVESYSDEWTSETQENEEESHELQEKRVYRYQVYTDVKKRYGSDWTTDCWIVKYVDKGPFTTVTADCECGGHGYYKGHEDSNICVHRYRVEYVSLAQHKGHLRAHPDFPDSWDVTWD